MSEEPKDTSSSSPGDAPSEQKESTSTHVDTSEIVVSGQGANININKASSQDYIAIHKFAFQQGVDWVRGQGQANHLQQDLAEDIRNKQEQKQADDAEEAATEGKNTSQLNTLDDIADWYDELDPYTQCLVQVVACLHGAQATDIARLLRTVWTTVAPPLPNGNEVAAQSPPPTSDRKLYQKACVEKKRVNDDLRLFWKDCDSVGQQRFTRLILRYLAEEALFTSKVNLEDTLKGWVENELRDCAWRAARALGIVLFWRNSHQGLWNLANTWAASSRTRDWRSAASLLSGAYNMEWVKDEERANNPRKSNVLRLLDQWIERSQKLAGWQVGCAAAEAYNLLDQRNPNIALDGLDKLLRFPGTGVPSDWNSISLRLFTVCISNYVSIAWSGHIRNVLERLALHARTLVYQQHFDLVTDELRYHGQCELHLEAVLTIFFLVAAFSFQDDDSSGTYVLTDALLAEPELPDEQERDILLAGVLSMREPQWRGHIVTLLCASFFVQKEEQALYVLRRWLITIEATTDTAKQQHLQMGYQRFIVELYQTIAEWEADPRRRGFGSIPASATFRHYLSSWLGNADWYGATNSTFIRTCTQKMLAQLEG